MKNRNVGSTSAAVQKEPSRTQLPDSQAARPGEEGATQDPSARQGAHTSTSNGLFVFSGPRASAANATVDVSSTALGSSTIVARRSRAISSAGETSDLTSLYAAAARITHARLYAEGQSMRFNIQVRESRAGKRPRASPISAGSRAARMVPERGRDVKITASGRASSWVAMLAARAWIWVFRVRRTATRARVGPAWARAVRAGLAAGCGQLRARAAPYPGRTRQADPGTGPARHGLRRDMSGSAPPLYV